jgi:hypothetical protein
LKVGQDDFLRQGQPDSLEGENEDGIAYHDEDGYDSEPATSASGFALPFPGLKVDVNTGNALSNNEPRPKRQRSLSIPIHYHSRFTTGMPIFEPQPLPIAYGWTVRGTAEHIEDLHLSGIPFCNKEVHSKTKIEVLGEYTWIEVTPSQEESYERFPAIYVPGTCSLLQHSRFIILPDGSTNNNFVRQRPHLATGPDRYKPRPRGGPIHHGPQDPR